MVWPAEVQPFSTLACLIAFLHLAFVNLDNSYLALRWFHTIFIQQKVACSGWWAICLNFQYDWTKWADSLMNCKFDRCLPESVLYIMRLLAQPPLTLHCSESMITAHSAGVLMDDSLLCMHLSMLSLISHVTTAFDMPWRSFHCLHAS